MFSDKTGTLTCNLMEFKKFSVGPTSYGIDVPHCKDALEKDVSNFNFEDPDFASQLADATHPNH